MKINLLLVASVFFGASAFAQFEESNSPAVGNGIQLFVIDETAPSYDSFTGTNVVWDYSGYESDSTIRVVSVSTAGSTSDGSDFPAATEAIDVEGFMQTYSSTSATEATGHGFVFREPSVDRVIAKYTTNKAILYKYPMDENSPEIRDTVEGILSFTLGGIPQSPTLTGYLNAKVDGKGTLKLATNEYEDVLRYKITDTLNATLPAMPPFFPNPTPVQLIRVQYEYYDHSVGNLPIFIHSSIDLDAGIIQMPTTLIMSKEYKASTSDLSKNDLENTSVYPNPANENLNIQLPSSIESANVRITDALGREVYISTLNSEVKTINVSHLNKGMYFVNISNNVYSTTKNVVIK